MTNTIMHQETEVGLKVHRWEGRDDHSRLGLGIGLVISYALGWHFDRHRLMKKGKGQISENTQSRWHSNLNTTTVDRQC